MIKLETMANHMIKALQEALANRKKNYYKTFLE